MEVLIMGMKANSNHFKGTKGEKIYKTSSSLKHDLIPVLNTKLSPGLIILVSFTPLPPFESNDKRYTSTSIIVLQEGIIAFDSA